MPPYFYGDIDHRLNQRRVGLSIADDRAHHVRGHFGRDLRVLRNDRLRFGAIRIGPLAIWSITTCRRFAVAPFLQASRSMRTSPSPCMVADGRRSVTEHAARCEGSGPKRFGQNAGSDATRVEGDGHFRERRLDQLHRFHIAAVAIDERLHLVLVRSRSPLTATVCPLRSAAVFTAEFFPTMMTLTGVVPL